MKKIVFILFFLPTFLFAQERDTFFEPIKEPHIFNYVSFDNLQATSSNFELPYLRYCIKKSINYRYVGYGFMALSASSFLIKNKAVAMRDFEKNEFHYFFEENGQILGYGLMGAGAVSFIISERWFARSAIKPVIHANGLGVMYKFK